MKTLMVSLLFQLRQAEAKTPGILGLLDRWGSLSGYLPCAKRSPVIGDNFLPGLEPGMSTRDAWAPGSLASDPRGDRRAEVQADLSRDGGCPTVTAGHKLRGAGRKHPR